MIEERKIFASLQNKMKMRKKNLDKNECRAFVKKTNLLHSHDEKKKLSAELEKKLLQVPEFLDSDIVLSFASSCDEVCTDSVNKKILFSSGEFSSFSQKKIALPKTLSKSSQMDFYFLQKTLSYEEQLEKSNFGIREPLKNDELRFSFENKNSIFKKKIFCIIPALAFDKNKNRLGHGKAFYDIYLSSLLKAVNQFSSKIFLCGICFNWQLLENLPNEKNDVKMDLVLMF